MTDKQTAEQERRNYFRVAQEVLFRYKPVEAYAANNEDPADQFDDSSSSRLVDELRKIDRDAAQSLKALADKDRHLSDYLRSLNQKIELIARYALFADMAEEQQQTPRRINLSEAGVAFGSDRAFYKGSFLAVRLVFPPHYIPVAAFAEVTRCQNKGDSHHVAARFYRLSDRERQELARQLMRAQIRQKKRSQASR